MARRLVSLQIKNALKQQWHSTPLQNSQSFSSSEPSAQTKPIYLSSQLLPPLHQWDKHGPSSTAIPVTTLKASSNFRPNPCFLLFSFVERFLGLVFLFHEIFGRREMRLIEVEEYHVVLQVLLHSEDRLEGLVGSPGQSGEVLVSAHAGSSVGIRSGGAAMNYDDFGVTGMHAEQGLMMKKKQHIRIYSVSWD